MAKRRNNSGREGESLLFLLALAAYFTYEKLIQYPLLASIVFGLVVALLIIATLLILRAQRVRKANLLAKESFYRDYSPVEFEHLTAEIFRQFGYKAHVTPPSGDEGLDVILSKDGKTIGVQCKNYKDSVGPAYIREFAGALQGAKISSGIFVTSSDYTEASRDAAAKSEGRITLISGEKLGELRNSAEGRINTDLIPTRWWSRLVNWQKAFLILFFFFVVTIVMSTAAYILISLLIV